LFLDRELERLVERQALVDAGVEVIELPESNAEWQEMLAGFAVDDPMIDVPTDAVMYQLYTSGTTGKPKGVMLTHDNLFCMAEQLADAWHFEDECVVYNPYPVFHGAGILWVLMPLLRNGETIFRRGFDEVDLLESIERYQVNITLMVPAVLNMVLNHERAQTADLSSLQHVIYGVAPISQAVLEKAIERLPNCAFHHAYGSTESAGTITTMQWDDHRPGTERMRSCGRPFDWLEMRIVDTESRVSLGTREVGEVAVRGRIVMKGYFDNPEETARVVDADGWLYTGDAGFVDEDGFLYLTDRIKDMIISGGENIYPAEVENVIFAMPEVQEVAVIGVPEEVWGEQVLAVVVPHRDATVDERAVIAYCREHLAHYKCPRKVVVRHEPLPLNPTGKVLRRVLRDPYWADQRFKV
jgi:long-chain acyl-CoA synthetase